ncbi:MAG: copper resistance protein NlpE [Flammeovirgaceae bacterium]|nr:copper resistance protein NlpE [Flammeovirgaceae bacterium]
MKTSLLFIILISSYLNSSAQNLDNLFQFWIPLNFHYPNDKNLIIGAEHYNHILEFTSEEQLVVTKIFENDTIPISILEDKEIIYEDTLHYCNIYKLTNDSLILDFKSGARGVYIQLSKNAKAPIVLNSKIKPDTWYNINDSSEIYMELLDTLHYDKDYKYLDVEVFKTCIIHSKWKLVNPKTAKFLMKNHYLKWNGIYQSPYDHTKGVWKIMMVNSVPILFTHAFYDGYGYELNILKEIKATSIRLENYCQGIHNEKLTFAINTPIEQSTLSQTIQTLTSKKWILKKNTFPPKEMFSYWYLIYEFSDLYSQEDTIKVKPKYFSRGYQTLEFNKDYTYSITNSKNLNYNGTWRIDQSGKFIELSNEGGFISILKIEENLLVIEKGEYINRDGKMNQIAISIQEYE